MDQNVSNAGLVGAALLNDPAHTKDTAFSLAERKARGLEGLLPHSVETLDRQFERAMQQLSAKDSDLERYIYLTGLSDRNAATFDKVCDPKTMVGQGVAAVAHSANA